MQRQEGQALVIVLVVMLILQIAAWAFVSRMNFEQRLAGDSVRSLSAFYAADAGLQKVLWALEELGPESFSNEEGSLPHQEALASGAFVIEKLEHLPGGLTSFVVRGEVREAVRRLKALVRTGPEALAYGLYGQAIVSFDGQARTYIVPCRAEERGCRRGGDLAVGGEVRFNSPHVALNDFRGILLPLREGRIADTLLLSAARGMDSASGLDIVLTGEAGLWSGIKQTPVGLDELRRQVRELGVRRLRVRAALQTPSVDANYYASMAEANTANDAINAAAGLMGSERGLREKTHSRYTEEEFEVILEYLKEHPAPMRGVLFVDGDITVPEHGRLTIVDGALILNGNIEIKPRARLEVQHGQTTRMLPGVVALGGGTIQIRKEAAAVIDGLILAGKDVQVDGGILDVIGSVVTRNFLSDDGTSVIRYDPIVLATAGLRSTWRGFVELLSWQELP